MGELAYQAFQQVHMLGSALGDDDLPHLAVIQYMVDVVIARHQRLGSQIQFSIHLYGLRRRFFMLKNAEVGVKTQTSQRQNLCASDVKHIVIGAE